MKLNLKFLFAVAGLFASIQSFSQFTYGAKLGLGMSNHTEVHIDSKSRIGLNGGVVMKYELGRSYQQFIQGELLYVSHGENNGDVKSHVNYISVPVLYKHYLTDNDRDFFLEIGPQFSYAISDKLDPYVIEKNGIVKDTSDNHVLNKFDFGVAVGFGFSIYRQYEIGLRYNYGFTDSFKHIYTDNGVNNSSLLGLSFTYFFDSYYY